MLDIGLAVVAATGFAALLITAVRRHLRDRQAGALELAQVLGVYAGLAAIVSTTMALPVHPGWVEAGDLVLAVGFGLIPVLMLRFARVFGAVPGWLWHASAALTPVLVCGALLFVLEVLPPALHNGWLAAFLVLWAGGHVLGALGLLRGGRATSTPIARRRAQLMAAAVFGLGSIMPVAGISGALTQDASITGVLLWSVLVVGLLLFGFAPPAAMRWHWSRHDRQELGLAQRRLLSSDDPDRLAADLLPHVARLAGGDAAWLIIGDEVVAAHPSDRRLPPEAGRSLADATTGVDGDLRTRADGRGVALGGDVRLTAVSGTRRRLLVAETDRSVLVVNVDPYALLLGSRDLESVGVLATQLDVAVDRARLRARELASVREREAARRVAEVERVRDDVLATVSHEMRTPLTTVCGVTSLLLDRWEHLDDTRRRQLLGRVAVNADDLRLVVEQILDLTAHRLAASGRAVQEATDVRELIESAVLRLGEAAAGHVVTVDGTAGARVHVDRPVVEQLLRHLLLNAVKFSPAASTVRAEARVVDDGLRLVVADEGIGMTDEDRRRAFEPFYRAGDVLRRETRGLGLGLALVAALAETIDARVQVTSQPGAGTTVTVLVPCATPARSIDLAAESVEA
jgi:K+-sensing histidine kinase KdpD